MFFYLLLKEKLKSRVIYVMEKCETNSDSDIPLKYENISS